MALDTQIPPSLSDLMTQDAMRKAQLYQMGQEGQLRNLQMGQLQQDIAQKARLRDLLTNLPEGQEPSALIPQLVRMGPEGMQMVGQIQGMYAKDNKPMVVGRTLMSPKGEVLGTDVTWAAEQEATRQAKMAELQARLREAGIAREDRMALQREMMNLRRDAITQGNKPPAGYRYTPSGDLEMIPGGPADVKSQAAAQRQADAGVDVDVAINSLRDAYDRLEKGGGITSTKKGTFSNLSASASASDIGQAFGRALGTSNQSARNEIAMTRPALLAALMKATGMSAKQMDSNAELKLWISTATDPTLDVEANRKALNNIERKYLRGQTGSSTATNPKYPGFSIQR